MSKDRLGDLPPYADICGALKLPFTLTDFLLAHLRPKESAEGGPVPGGRIRRAGNTYAIRRKAPESYSSNASTECNACCRGPGAAESRLAVVVHNFQPRQVAQAPQRYAESYSRLAFSLRVGDAAGNGLYPGRHPLIPCSMARSALVASNTSLI